MEVAEYCREIETYLCRKNDGHLIRVVGPSFELVSKWATDGIPLKVAFGGIDRYFERYYRKGPRRRPVRIDFCEADVLDVFDEWRRALGLRAELDDAPPSGRASGSLKEHLERAMLRLTNARATGRLSAAFDPLIDRVSTELDRARGNGRGVRGDARHELLARLAVLDGEFVKSACAELTDAERRALQEEAEADLAEFRVTMPADAYARACQTALDRLVRERRGLPVLTF